MAANKTKSEQYETNWQNLIAPRSIQGQVFIVSTPFLGADWSLKPSFQDPRSHIERSPWFLPRRRPTPVQHSCKTLELCLCKNKKVPYINSGNDTFYRHFLLKRCVKETKYWRNTWNRDRFWLHVPGVSEHVKNIKYLLIVWTRALARFSCLLKYDIRGLERTHKLLKKCTVFPVL